MIAMAGAVVAHSGDSISQHLWPSMVAYVLQSPETLTGRPASHKINFHGVNNSCETIHIAIIEHVPGCLGVSA